ncbi:unnamed protein product [Amoebophrya sp. A25]|nr:unnamed protein product [Amoebophrya sp. A25]|eukprot:GSA25T00011663001.1
MMSNSFSDLRTMPSVEVDNRRLDDARDRFCAVRVIDGGLATQLETAYACDLGGDNGALWSTSVLEKNPELVEGAHRDFVRAGCNMLITCTYQTSLRGFNGDRSGFEASLRRAVDVAVRAALAHEQKSALSAGDRSGEADASKQVGTPDSLRTGACVAGSLGPYGACLAGGQEYTGEYALTNEVTGVPLSFAQEVTFLKNWHRDRAKVLAEHHSALNSLPGTNNITEQEQEEDLGLGCPSRGRIDVFAGETCPKIAEAVALAEIFEETKMLGYISFQCRDGERLASGEKMEDAVAALAPFFCKESAFLVALGVNCTAVGVVEGLVGRLKQAIENEMSAEPDQEMSQAKNYTKRRSPTISSPRPSKHKSAQEKVSCMKEMQRPRIIVYPNSGEEYDPETKTWHPASEAKAGGLVLTYGEYARKWLHAGAHAIGGCCRVMPHHIEEVCTVVGT